MVGEIAVSYATLPLHPHSFTSSPFSVHYSPHSPHGSSGKKDCLMLLWLLGVPSAPTLCSLDRSECESIASEGPNEMGHSAWLCVLFMSRPCWVGSYSASKSQMWFNLCSIHCPDRWPLITSKVPGCWISAGALCYRTQSASLIAQRSITIDTGDRPGFAGSAWSDRLRCIYNIY